MTSKQPTVSIGLPVHNGENYLAECIESILRQSLRDFELIISDNASSDGTPDICRRYARQDPRIRYVRQETNRGAGPNFNLCFELATGKYFKWQAHDDLIEPTYLERCVACLDAAPEALLCQSLVTVIDHDGAALSRHDPRRFRFGAERPSARLRGVLRALSCVEIFGVIRRDALLGTALIANFIGSDRVLLADLVLRGRFVVVAEALFRHRDHPGRSVRLTRSGLRPGDVAAWFSPDVRRNVFQRWTFLAASWRLIRRRITKLDERVRCYVNLITSLHHRWVLVFLLLEPPMAIDDRTYDAAKWIKRSVTALNPIRALVPSGWNGRAPRSPS